MIKDIKHNTSEAPITTDVVGVANIDRQIAEDVALYLQLSLTEAQQRMCQHPKYSNPYYWAGFIVVD